MTPRMGGVTVVLLSVLLTGCASVPRDPEGTLERVRQTGVLTVGASPSEGQVVLDGEQARGPEPELVRGFATSLGARVEWRPGGEEELVKAMDDGEIDLLIGGLSDQNAWASDLGATRPYRETHKEGESVKHIMAVPMGENAMLSALEAYLDEAVPD